MPTLAGESPVDVVQPGRGAARRRTLILLGLGLCLLTILAAVTWAVVRPRTFTLKSGTIVALDLPRRTGTVEFMLKSGQMQRVEAFVPEDCPVLIDGRPGPIDQVCVGDRVAAVVTRYATQVRARQVEVFRAAPAEAAAPAAASPAASGPPGPK